MFTDGSVAATETGGITPRETQAFYNGDNNNRRGLPIKALTKNVEEREIGSNGFAIAPSPAGPSIKN